MFRMEVSLDGNGDKRRILYELSRCLKTVFVEASSSNNSSVCLSLSSPLIHCIDRSLQHGLLNLLHSYWPLVQSCSHTQTLSTIDNWVGSHGSYRLKGKAWLLATLVEGSLLSYLQCMLAEPNTISSLYAPHAILRDPSTISQLSSLLTGIESINFFIEESTDTHQKPSVICGVEENSSAIVNPMLELSLGGSNGLLGTALTSSITSSLASPGDSGFTQLDSETDTASFSEITLEADSISVKEDVAVLPVDACTEKTIGWSSTMEPVNINDANSTGCTLPELHGGVSDEVVKRPKIKTGNISNIKQQKRVSFHECTHSDSTEDGHMSSKDSEKSNSPLQVSALNLSRAVGDLSSFNSEQEGVEIAKDSFFLGNDGIEVLHVNTFHVSTGSVSRVENYLHSVKSVILPQYKKNVFPERGIPEGQEDPPHKCSVSTDQPSASTHERVRHLNISSSASSCSSLRPQVSTPRRQAHDFNSLSNTLVNTSASVLSQTPSKACLVNRFLRSITEKKISNSRAAAALCALNKNKSTIRKLELYIDGVKPVDTLCQELLDELTEEMSSHALKSSLNFTPSNHLRVEITSTLDDCLHSQLQLPSNEQILRILKVRDISVDDNGTRAPLLAVISSEALYVINHKMLKHYVIVHSDLSSFMVGPNSQWISLMSLKKSTHIKLLIGGPANVSDLIATVELVLRRKSKKPFTLPSVIHLQEEAFKVSQWTSVLQGEKVCNYSVVDAFEECPSPPCSPSGLNMRAVFMFRILSGNSISTWEPGYFVLKAGILKVFLEEEEVSPQYSISLQGVKCCSIAHSLRPHTIEVGFLQIAAPDDYVANKWLDALQKSSLGVFDSDATDQKLNIVCGALVLTENRLMLLNCLGIPEKDLDQLSKPLLSAYVSEVTSLRIGNPDSCWCIVEFSCREVHESGGDHVVFFSTYDDRKSFVDSLGQLKPSIKQSTNFLSKSDPFHLRCDKITTSLLIGWKFDGLMNQ